MAFAYLLPIIAFLFQFEEISHDLQTTKVRFGGSVRKLRSEDTLGLKSGSRTGVSDVLGEWLGSCGTRLRWEDNRPKAVAPGLMGNQDYSVQASQGQEELRTSHGWLLHAEISCR